MEEEKKCGRCGVGFLLANPFTIAFVCFGLYFILNNNNQQGGKK